MINVIICDDHQLFIQGVVQGLEEATEINIIDTALSGKELLEKVRNNAVDVVLLDIEMPGMNGLEVAATLSQLAPEVKILALSMHDNATMIHRMIKSGARGYLIKNTTSEEITQAIRAVFKGERFFKGGVLNKIIEFNGQEKENDRIELLTEREIEILKLIADGLSNSEIADELFISIHTVHSHRRNMLKKLGLKNTAELLKIGYQNDLI